MGEQILELMSDNDITNCQDACMAQREAPMCDGYDLDKVTQNCSLFSGDYFSASVELTDNTNSDHSEWLCVNGK